MKCTDSRKATESAIACVPGGLPVCQTEWTAAPSELPLTPVLAASDEFGQSGDILRTVCAYNPAGLSQHAVAGSYLRLFWGCEVDYDGNTQARVRNILVPLSGKRSPHDAQEGMSHHGEPGQFYQGATGFVSPCTTPRSGLTGMFNHSGLAFSVIELKHLTEDDDLKNQAQ